MTAFVLVHGAFRGGWSWAPVAGRLRAAGHAVTTPDLTGMGTGAGVARPDPPPDLARWADDVVVAAGAVAGSRADSAGVVLVGHSQGGVPVAAAAPELARRGLLAGLALLDAAVPGPGERAVDLTPGMTAGTPLPPPDTWLDPTPLGDDAGLDPATRRWADERLCATPLRPSLDAIRSPLPEVPTRWAFCTGTPAGYPSATTRARLAAAGVPFTLLDSGHDAPLSAPDAVTDWLTGGASSTRGD